MPDHDVVILGAGVGCMFSVSPEGQNGNSG
jgi:hypothetical protein